MWQIITLTTCCCYYYYKTKLDSLSLKPCFHVKMKLFLKILKCFAVLFYLLFHDGTVSEKNAWSTDGGGSTLKFFTNNFILTRNHSFSCKNHRYKTENIKILLANSRLRCWLSHLCQSVACHKCKSQKKLIPIFTVPNFVAIG